MNERMLEIKALNLILCLLYMLILVSWSRFHIAVHSAVDAQEILQHGHCMYLLLLINGLTSLSYLFTL